MCEQYTIQYTVKATTANQDQIRNRQSNQEENIVYGSSLQPFLLQCTLKDILTNSCTLLT